MMSLFSRLGKWRQSRFNQMVGIKLKARSNLSASFLSTSSGTPTLLERAATTLKSKNILHEMIRKYGKLAFVSYGFISILSCTFWYFAFQYGLEPRYPISLSSFFFCASNFLLLDTNSNSYPGICSNDFEISDLLIA